MADCFGIIGGQITDIRLAFTRQIAPYVRERIWHRSQRVEPQGDGSIELTMRVGISPELEAWLLGFGPNMRVLEPERLRERIRRLHAEASRA